jgi:DNA replication protein DnaC
MAHGLLTLPRYINADLSRVHREAPDEIKQLCSKFVQIPREQFFKDSFSMYLFGNYRVGKTWFLHAIANHIIKVFKERSLWYVTHPQLLNYFQTRARRDEDTLWTNWLASRRILLLDDLGQDYRGSGTGFSETKLENFLRWRWGHRKITYIAGNGTVDVLRKLYGDSFAQFIGGEFVQFEVSSNVNMSRIILEEKLSRK